MKIRNCLLLMAVWLASAAPSFGSLNDRQWDVDGVSRTGTVFTPDEKVQKPDAGWPVVFVFHGHGGTARQIRRQFKVDTLWPQAVVVYLQGLPTIGKLTDPKGTKAGWEMAEPSDKNKDLRFYDVVLKDLTEHQHIDAKRVFSTGHSNGGGFTFTLWAHRGDTLAAVAACSSIAIQADWPLLKPKPAMMSSGENDPLVKFDWQEKMMDRIKSINGITGNGTAWGDKDGTWYDSTGGTPLATIIYDGGHAPPSDIGQRVVEFFKTVSPDVTKDGPKLSAHSP